MSDGEGSYSGSGHDGGAADSDDEYDESFWPKGDDDEARAATAPYHDEDDSDDVDDENGDAAYHDNPMRSSSQKGDRYALEIETRHRPGGRRGGGGGGGGSGGSSCGGFCCKLLVVAVVVFGGGYYIGKSANAPTPTARPTRAWVDPSQQSKGQAGGAAHQQQGAGGAGTAGGGGGGAAAAGPTPTFRPSFQPTKAKLTHAPSAPPTPAPSARPTQAPTVHPTMPTATPGPVAPPAPAGSGGGGDGGRPVQEGDFDAHFAAMAPVWLNNKKERTASIKHVASAGGEKQWDAQRVKDCAPQNKRRADNPPPAPLVHALARDAVTGDAVQPFAPGDAPEKDVGGLPFDPATVKGHFVALRAALVDFYEGKDTLEKVIAPYPGHPDHAAMVQALSRPFARAMVHGDRPFVIGVLGDSTAAGADNCYYDSWPRQLERLLKPLFAAAGGLVLEVRNTAHNGGYTPDAQMPCALAMLGADADLVIASWPYVTVDKKHYEMFARRALAHGSGMVPSVGCDAGSGGALDRYYKLGLTQMTGAQRGVLVYQSGIKKGGPYPWFPRSGAGREVGWGRRGDGFCHTGLTRSGSAPVMMRNWHSGPLGYQVFSDTYGYLYAEAAIAALDSIAAEYAKAGGGKAGLEHLRSAVWPRGRAAAEAGGGMPKPSLCSEADTQHGFATGCGVGMMPSWGARGSISKWVKDGGNWQHQVTGARSNNGKNNEKGETRRQNADCEHLDKVESYRGDKSTGTIKFLIPKGVMKAGTLTICNLNRDKGYSETGPKARPVFKVGGQTKAPPSGYTHKKQREGGRGSCMVVAKSLALGVDLDFEVTVTGSGGFEIAYVIAE